MQSAQLSLHHGPGPRPRVREGTIRLNGVEVVGPRDFHRPGAVIERRVPLQAQNTLAVRLAGRPGSAVTVSLLTRTPCLALAFTAPAPGAVVPAGPLVVQGTVRGPAEVGVVVQGVRAAVQGGRFAALVPVEVGVSALVAVATLPDGTTREARLPVTVTPAPEDPLALRARPPGGAAPLAVRFRALGLPDGECVLDLGDGRQVVNPDLEADTFAYDRPGLYLPTLTVTDSTGGTRSATALVEVADRAAFDAVLQARWTAMKAALRAGDVATALGAVAIGERDHYRTLLSALTLPLSRIDEVLTDISLVSFDELEAEYGMRRVEDGQELSYYVRFVRDADGIWRLEFF